VYFLTDKGSGIFEGRVDQGMVTESMEFLNLRRRKLQELHQSYSHQPQAKRPTSRANETGGSSTLVSLRRKSTSRT